MNEETHAKAYDTVTNPVLEMIVPTQSILSFSCLLMHCKDFGLSSFGSIQAPTSPTSKHQAKQEAQRRRKAEARKPNVSRLTILHPAPFLLTPQQAALTTNKALLVKTMGLVPSTSVTEPASIRHAPAEEKSCTLMSWVITIIALVVESVVVEGSGASNGVSSSEELASVSRVAGVASPEDEFLCVEGPDVVGVLSSSLDPRSRTCNSTAGCFPIFFCVLSPLLTLASLVDVQRKSKFQRQQSLPRLQLCRQSFPFESLSLVHSNVMAMKGLWTLSISKDFVFRTTADVLIWQPLTYIVSYATFPFITASPLSATCDCQSRKWGIHVLVHEFFMPSRWALCETCDQFLGSMPSVPLLERVEEIEPGLIVEVDPFRVVFGKHAAAGIIATQIVLTLDPWHVSLPHDLAVNFLIAKDGPENVLVATEVGILLCASQSFSEEQAHGACCAYNDS
ncbi:hypothetical protein KCV03_g204, partial [Aureobasidium melanogenum]